MTNEWTGKYECVQDEKEEMIYKYMNRNRPKNKHGVGKWMIMRRSRWYKPWIIMEWVMNEEIDKYKSGNDEWIKKVCNWAMYKEIHDGRRMNNE